MMNEIFKTIYERLTNNSRRNNPANVPTIYGEQPESQSWDARTARQYGAYAEARTFEGKGHDEAVALMEKRIK